MRKACIDEKKRGDDGKGCNYGNGVGEPSSRVDASLATTSMHFPYDHSHAFIAFATPQRLSSLSLLQYPLLVLFGSVPCKGGQKPHIGLYSRGHFTFGRHLDLFLCAIDCE